MTGTPNREALQQILQASRRREQEIRLRMEWIEAHRRELWKRLDRAEAETPRGTTPPSATAER